MQTSAFYKNLIIYVDCTAEEMKSQRIERNCSGNNKIGEEIVIMMYKCLPITDIYAREIIDSRGNPTVEVEVLAGEAYIGRAAREFDTSFL